MNYTNGNGKNVLHYAAESFPDKLLSSAAIFDLLVNLGVPLTNDNDGKSALSYLIQNITDQCPNHAEILPAINMFIDKF
jgi:hypothetical protein